MGEVLRSAAQGMIGVTWPRVVHQCGEIYYSLERDWSPGYTYVETSVFDIGVIDVVNQQQKQISEFSRFQCFKCEIFREYN